MQFGGFEFLRWGERLLGELSQSNLALFAFDANSDAATVDRTELVGLGVSFVQARDSWIGRAFDRLDFEHRTE